MWIQRNKLLDAIIIAFEFDVRVKKNYDVTSCPIE